MQQLDIWGWVGDSLQKLPSSNVDFAFKLTDWLARDPRLLQPGLVIVGRQLPLDGERLELLALDNDGRWAVIKIAPGALTRAHLTSALQHAAAINALPFDDLESRVNAYLAAPANGRASSLAQLLAERKVSPTAAAERRDIQIYLVGAGQDAGLPQLIAYMSGQCHFALRTAIYTAYENESGQRFVARQLIDLAPAATRQPERARPYNRQTPINIPSPRPASAPATSAPATDASPAVETPGESPLSYRQTADWAQKSASQIWRLAREMAGFPPTDLSSNFGRRSEAARLLRMADAGDIGNSLRYLLQLAEQQGLLPIFSAGAVQFAQPEGKRRVLFTARAWAEKNRPGYLPLILHLSAIAQAYKPSVDELSKIFWPQGRRDITFSETHQFVKSFRKLAQK